MCIAQNIAGDLAVNIGEFLGEKLNQQLGHKAETSEPEFDIFFSTLRVRANSFFAKGQFAQGCPTQDGKSVTYASRSKIVDQKETVEVTSVFTIGFWGIHILITNSEEANLSAWNHSLERRNFGSVALCRDAVVLHEQPIHYS